MSIKMSAMPGICLLLAMLAPAAYGKTLHVSVKGNDANPGTPELPLRTIQHAAELARAGDTVMVHEGIYREYVNPPRGGASDAKRIVYEAAPGEKAVIKGSELIKGWTRVKNEVWRVKIPNSFFGGFNPYKDLIHGDWFDRRGRDHHSGAVYLNGDWLTEAAALDEVLAPGGKSDSLWFGRVDGDSTTIWARFGGADPNRQTVEINVRRTVFYPEKTGIDYITVRGFTLEDAATPWAPPTAQQIGLIGPNWSKGWVIEDNVVRYSMCSGISLGKYGDRWDNTSANSAGGYVETVQRALKDGWTPEQVGHHVVKNNLIAHCEQAGIVGSLGAIFSTVSGNTIHDICSRRWLAGAEQAGIKFHAAVDVSITGNHIYRTCLGIWLDWMAQGTYVSGNLLNDNGGDMFVEVDHGPFTVVNNLFLSRATVTIRSQGGAYLHNLFAGAVRVMSYDARQTPFLKRHSTGIAGFHDNPLGDNCFYNNIFSGHTDLRIYDTVALSSKMDGNVFLHGARPSDKEARPVVGQNFDPGIRLIKSQEGFALQARFDKGWMSGQKRKLVTAALLGKTVISGLPYEAPDGQPIRIDTDYYGKPRNKDNPAPGPFEDFRAGENLFDVYRKK
ncbi:right-handed parallel beta-helix repeat-containing protein [Compostibacter hankyongensis]